MNKINKVKFFLVAATLMGSIANAASPGEDASEARDQQSPGESSKDESGFNWGGDPNGEIGVPGTSVVDSAVDSPLPVNCHDCEIAARDGSPRTSLFEARGATAAGQSSGAPDAKQ